MTADGEARDARRAAPELRSDGGEDSVVYRIDVEVTAPVYGTEVTARVADAIRTLFPEAETEQRPGELAGTAHSMEQFSELLHRQEILDTARERLFANHRDDVLSFSLKKQAAFEGVVNFAVGEPDELGELHVRVQVEEPGVGAFVDHVAPPTEDGRPIDDR